MICSAGTADNNSIWGHTGNDTIYGRAGDDYLYGGEGDDVLDGGAGEDWLDGGAGEDTVTYFASTAGVAVNLAIGTSTGAGVGGDAADDNYLGIENVEGSAFADVLIGDAGDNKVWGNGGNDQLTGGAGNDQLHGGDGHDALRGATTSTSSTRHRIRFTSATSPPARWFWATPSSPSTRTCRGCRPATSCWPRQSRRTVGKIHETPVTRSLMPWQNEYGVHDVQRA